MPLTVDQILSEAMALSPADREAVAYRLLASLSDEDCESLDAAWLAEAKRRDAAYLRGETTAAPVDEVVARVLARKKQ